MPLNDKKIISIILDQGKTVPERFDGYREEIVSVIADIITYERAHRVERTDIQKKIFEKCDAAARLLNEKRNGVSSEVES
jgi:hypothetical protein